MKFRFTNSFITLGFTLMLFFSCKKEDYPIQPILTYKDFQVEGDSGILIVQFTDGDGDIGLKDDEVNAPYNFGSGYYYNYNIAYFEKNDSLGWVPGTNVNGDTIVHQYRINPFTDLSEKQPLKGTIETVIEPSYYNTLSSDSDTIRYKVQLIDRALNKSEWLETPVITR